MGIKIINKLGGGITLSTKFQGVKLFDAIILTEQRVASLYNKLASQVEDDKAKNLFLNLAKDEERHEQIYKALKAKLPNDGEVELNDSEKEYTQMLIDTNIFMNKNIEKRYSKFDALVMAEKVERDGILLINQLKSIFPSLESEELDTVLSEEKKHLKKVLDIQFDSSVPSLML